MKRKILNLLLALLIMCPLYNVNAAGLSVYSSASTVVIGSTVRVTVNASGIAGRFSISTSNSGVLSGGSGSEWIENESKTFTFSAKSAGSATITVSPINAAYSDGSGKVTSGKSVTINVVKPREKSTNNNLRSLSIEGQEISPAFNKNTLEYTAIVGDEIEKIKINAVMEDGYGHTEGAGEKELVEGINKFEIKAISETGTVKTYMLTVTVKDNNPINKTIDGKTYSLVKRASSLVLPEGLDKEKFESGKITIDEVEIPAYVSSELGLTFIGLKDDNGIIYLFKYVEGKIDKKYELLTSSILNIEFLEAKDIPENYTKTVIKIGEKEYTVYRKENDKDYSLIYGKNIETNDEGWYIYNQKENTIQKYNLANDQKILELNEQVKKEQEKNNILLIIIAGISVLAFIIILIEIIFNSKMRKALKKITSNEIISNNDLSVVVEPLTLEEKKEEVKDIKKGKNKTKRDKKPKETKKEEVKEELLSEIAETVEEAEKVEDASKKTSKKSKQKNEEEKINTDNLLPTLEEIEEDLKPIEDIKVDNEEDEALKEMEEFYGKVKKSKKNRL